MRELSEPLPSNREAEQETKIRLELINEITPSLIPVSEAILLVGSVAYGKFFSVRKNSDIDLLILIQRDEVDKIFGTKLFPLRPQYQEAITLFKDKRVDHFTIKEDLKGVEVQFHFWDKEAHFRAERLELPNPKSYKSMRPNPKFLTNNDFSGNKKCTPVGQVDRFQYGIVYEYPPYFIADNKFVPKEPILNLIADPDILFCRDKQLQKNIDQLWEKLSERLLEESGGTINLESSNIIFSIYGHWNMSADSRKKLESRQKLELERAIKKLK